MKLLVLWCSVAGDRLYGGVTVYLGLSECFVKLGWWLGVLFALHGLEEHLMWVGLCSTWRPNTVGGNEQWLQNVRGQICRVRTTCAGGVLDRWEGHIKKDSMHLGPVSGLHKIVTCNNFSSVCECGLKRATTQPNVEDTWQAVIQATAVNKILTYAYYVVDTALYMAFAGDRYFSAMWQKHAASGSCTGRVQSAWSWQINLMFLEISSLESQFSSHSCQMLWYLCTNTLWLKELILKRELFAWEKLCWGSSLKWG